VIRFAAQDRAGSVQLLGQDQARKFVLKRPWRDRENQRSALSHAFVETKRATDDEGRIFGAIASVGDPLCKRAGRQCPTTFVQDDDGAGCPLEEALGLATAHFVGGQGLSRLGAYFVNLERPISRGTRFVLANRFPQRTRRRPADSNDSVLHVTTRTTRGRFSRP
jgi:hypothetical protein